MLIHARHCCLTLPWGTLLACTRQHQIALDMFAHTVMSSTTLYRSGPTVALIIKKPSLAALAQRFFGGLHEVGPGF